MPTQSVLNLPTRKPFRSLWFMFFTLACLLPANRGWAEQTGIVVSDEVEKLNDKSETLEVRVSAARALGHLTPPTDDAIRALIQALNDKSEDARVRKAAANALAVVGRVPEESDRAILALVQTLADRHSADSLQAAAARALGKIFHHSGQAEESGQTIAVLVDALTKPGSDPMVRANAAWSLGQIGVTAEDGNSKEKNETVRALIQAVRNTNVNIGQTAAQSLVRMYQAAVPELTRRLAENGDANFKWNVARILGEIGKDAKDSVPTLTRLLRDEEEDPNLRGAAAWVIGKIGVDAKAGTPNFQDTISVLTNALRNKDNDPNIRSNAAWALGRMGPTAKPDGATFPDIVAAELGDAIKDKDPDIRRNAVWALGQVRPDPNKTLDGLAAALQKDLDPRVRVEAAIALGQIGSLGRKESRKVKALVVALKEDDESAVRRQAAISLGQIGEPAEGAIDQLVDASNKPKDQPGKEKEGDKSARSAAAEALAKIAKALAMEGRTIAIERLKAVAADLKQNDYLVSAADVQSDVEMLQSRRWFNNTKGLFAWIQRYRVQVLLFCGYVIAWLLLYWKNPYLVFRINEAVKRFAGHRLPKFLGGIPLSYLILGGFFHYRPRVLDAWVTKHIDSARQKFDRKLTVDQRKVHVELPAALEGIAVSGLSPATLRPFFGRKRICLLIAGEGGAGKTSLACQICKWAMTSDHSGRLTKHAMMGILLELENFEASNGEDILLEAVRMELGYLIDPADAPSEELVQKLLENQRLLVVIDGFSEMSEAKRKNFQPGKAKFAAHALVMTSRLEESPTGIDLTVIKPMRVQGDHLSTFMDAYLVQRNKKDLFSDAEYFEDLGKLSKMVGERDITVLLARLYAEQMIASKEARLRDKLPENIPDLMLEYLNALNRKVVQRKLDDRIVHRIAKTIAWECLRDTCRPMPARIDKVVQKLDGEVPAIEERLRFLEDSLRLVQTVGPGHDRIRFTLDPLAEYLAALKVMEDLSENEEGWWKFLAEIDSAPGAPEAIRGFLLAVRDCCLTKGDEVSVPSFVCAELGRIAALDPAFESKAGGITAKKIFVDGLRSA